MVISLWLFRLYRAGEFIRCTLQSFQRRSHDGTEPGVPRDNTQGTLESRLTLLKFPTAHESSMQHFLWRAGQI